MKSDTRRPAPVRPKSARSTSATVARSPVGRPRKPPSDTKPAPAAKQKIKPINSVDPTIHSSVTGVPFVRMLHPAGRIRPVIATFIPERLMDGYRFLEGEPTVPRTKGRPGIPDDEAVARHPRARRVNPMHSIKDARNYWIRCMEEDANTFYHNKNLLFAYIHSARSSDSTPFGVPVAN